MFPSSLEPRYGRMLQSTRSAEALPTKVDKFKKYRVLRKRLLQNMPWPAREGWRNVFYNSLAWQSLVNNGIKNVC